MQYSDNKVVVSIGIPFYNAAQTLLDAIRSVFAQTFPEWELILVDDGSVDNSLTIANSIKDSRVKVISDGMHKGLIFRLNQIILMANGKYIARMDADDIMHPYRIQTQVEYLETNPRVDVVGTAMYSIGNNFAPIGKRSLVTDGITDFKRISRGVFIHVSIMARKEWFRQNLYDERFIRAEDQELWVRTYKKSVFANLKEPLVYVREIDSVNLKKYAQSARTMRKIFKTYGPSEIGVPLTLSLIFQSYCKVALYYAATFLRLQEVLIGSRNRPLSETEKEDAVQGIQRILKTAVPRNSDEEINP